MCKIGKIHFIRIILISILLIINIKILIKGQINYSIFAEVTATEGDNISIDNNNRGDNPFNAIRAKLFVGSQITDKIGVFSKFLVDDGASSSYGDKIRIEGLYFLFNINDYFKIKIGKVPVNIGNFPERSYMERTALIGSPLFYQYRTSIPVNRLVSPQEILSLRGTHSGANIVYEACWPEGIEFFSNYKKVEYKFAINRTAYANMRANTNNGYEFAGRFGLRPVVGLRFGVGYAYSPYLNGDATNIPAGKKVEDYVAKIYCADFEYSYAYFEFYAEWLREYYSQTYNNTQYYGSYKKDMYVDAYYIEGKYKLTPRIYAAGRFDQLLFSNIIDYGRDLETPWDYNINRLEIGFGYKLSPKMVIKGVSQFNIYKNAPLDDITIYAVQLKTEL